MERNCWNNNFRRTAAHAAFLLLSVGLALGTAQPAFADDEHSEVAGSGETAAQKDVLKYGMTPIAGSQIKDGTWEITVDSSSEFFRIEKAELTVENGEMTAALTMSSYSYTLLYMGTAEEAAAAPASDYISYEDIDDWYVFTVPVSALNKEIDCAAFSDRRQKWYRRKILFDASSLPEEALNGLKLPDYDLIQEAVDAYSGADGDSASGEVSGDSGGDSASGEVSGDSGGAQDSGTENGGSTAEAMDIDLDDGEYSIDVDITGGSGRAGISTPCRMIVRDGKAYAKILWSSTYYDWMKVGGKTYKNETTDGGNSSFTIPITAMDTVIPIVADTTAMGDPVAIDYSLTFYRNSIGDVGLIPQVAAKKVIIAAAVLVVGGFFLNLVLKKRRKYR